jgi:hypothetical protein
MVTVLAQSSTSLAGAHIAPVSKQDSHASIKHLQYSRVQTSTLTCVCVCMRADSHATRARAHTHTHTHQFILTHDVATHTRTPGLNETVKLKRRRLTALNGIHSAAKLPPGQNWQ